MLKSEPRRLRQRSISLGVHPGEADDVAQTIALKAWGAVDAVRSVGYQPLCAWLDTIARNAAQDHSRLQSRRHEVELDEHIPSPDDVTTQAELSTRVHEALSTIAALPDSLRVPLIMSVVDGATTEQIAASLGLSHATVRQRISRARRALAKQLETER